MFFVYHQRKPYRRLRRCADIFIAGIALLVSSPVLLAAAIAILIEDGGPIFFRQRRVGRFGRLFTMYKLRTMTTNACIDARKPAEHGDARITRVGRLLRKTSVDELPQFINVLRGDMSVVGPRPEMPFIVYTYERWQYLRLLAPPGITGLWQTTCRSTIPLDHPEATRRDLDYIGRASVAFDVTLMARTVTTMFSARGAF